VPQVLAHGPADSIDGAIALAERQAELARHLTEKAEERKELAQHPKEMTEKQAELARRPTELAGK
jgi:hypothetical protein